MSTPKLAEVAKDVEDLTALLLEQGEKRTEADQRFEGEVKDLKEQVKILQTTVATLQAPPVTGWKVLLSLVQALGNSEKAILLLLGGLLSLIALLIACAAGLLHEHPQLWPWGVAVQKVGQLEGIIDVDADVDQQE